MVINMIIDSHAHYDDKAFDEDRSVLLSGMVKNGIEKIINVAADLASCKSTLALTGEFSFIYGALGVHPSDTQELNDGSFSWIKEECIKHSVKNGGRICAVGEIGLDYYWDDPDRSIQKKWFMNQIEMAKEVNLPLIIHSRDAAKDTLEIMKETGAGEAGGVIHCYSYSKEIAAEFLEMGFYIGIGGVVTFKNAKKLKEVVEYVPMDRILIETDCPYLAPEPLRGKRNCSLYLRQVVDKIAEIRKITSEQVIECTAGNTEKLFFHN